MPLVIDWVTIDSPHPRGLADFWRRALDYEEIEADDDEVLIGPGDGSRRRLLFFKVDDPKRGKNRLHLDLRPADRDAEVARLVGLGATTVDIGQDDVTWVVMADPDGNEFCVLRALRPEENVRWGD